MFRLGRHQARVVIAILGVTMLAVSIGFRLVSSGTFLERGRVKLASDAFVSVGAGRTCAASPASSGKRIEVYVPVDQAFVIELRSSDMEAARRQYRVPGVGLEISPNDWVPLASVSESSTELLARWSARSTAPGEVFPVMSVKTPEGSPAPINDKTCRWALMDGTSNPVFVPNQNFFKITVVSTPIYIVQRFGPYIGALFGSLLTIPGLMTFVRERRNRMKEQSRIEIARELPRRNT